MGVVLSAIANAYSLCRCLQKPVRSPSCLTTSCPQLHFSLLLWALASIRLVPSSPPVLSRLLLLPPSLPLPVLHPEPGSSHTAKPTPPWWFTFFPKQPRVFLNRVPCSAHSAPSWHVLHRLQPVQPLRRVGSLTSWLWSWPRSDSQVILGPEVFSV